MKKSILILVAFALVMQYAHGKSLNAFFSYCTFDQPGKSPYIETYLNVAGASVKPDKNPENKFQGKIEVQWTYKQKDKIVHFDKYNLLSPANADASQPIPDFIDQQRVPLANGDYIIELKITDKNSSDQSYVTTHIVSINYPSGKINISDIEFLESHAPTVTAGTFSKSGYDLVPFVSNYFPPSADVLKFYAEIYNTKEVLGDENFLVSYSISGHQNKTIISNLIGYKKQKASEINMIMAELPIGDLSSGNYNLCIEVRDKANKLVASRQLFFQRSKPDQKQVNPEDLTTIKTDNTFVSYMTSKDTLKDYISSLYPISSQPEVDMEENQMNYNNLEAMQKFFYYFWNKRNPQNPEQAWINYKKEVDKVNAEFSCIVGKGFDSDRGRVYLQYGEPSSVDKTYFEGEGIFEKSAYPYEIWQYAKTKEQSNVKFVFMSRNLSANCFELIHSTARGEFYDANWMTRLRTESKSNSMFGNIDHGDDYNHNGSNNGFKNTKANDDFNHPK